MQGSIARAPGLGDFGIAVGAGMTGKPRRARIDLLRRNRFPSAGATLDLDFVNQQGYAFGQGLGRIRDLVTISGGVGGTVVDRTGAIVAASAPRFDFDPVTLACRGLLIEEQRTALLLNSLIDGTNLSTQSVTVTAQAYTLSFYGTGTVTLSGVSSAGPAVGSGAYPTRTTLTFTPTAGSLTLTVAGTVQYAKLEAGSFATSFTPTAGAAVTRTADSAVISGAKLADLFNLLEGTFVVQFDTSLAASQAKDSVALALNDNLRFVYVNHTSQAVASWDGSTGVGGVGGTGANGLPHIAVSSYALGARRAIAFGTGLATGSCSGSYTSGSSLSIGCSAANVNALNGHIQRITYWPRELPTEQLRALALP